MEFPESKILMHSYEFKHFSQLLNIWNEVITEEDCLMYDKPFSSDAFLDMLSAQSAVGCATLDDGAVAGFYMLRPNFVGKGSHIATASYAVGKDYRATEAGKILAADSLQKAEYLGFTAMQFNVASTNTGAIRLWQTLGFVVLGEIPYAYQTKRGGKASVYIFHKSIYEPDETQAVPDEI